jgi:hypothetical protein
MPGLFSFKVNQEPAKKKSLEGHRHEFLCSDHIEVIDHA